MESVTLPKHIRNRAVIFLEKFKVLENTFLIFIIFQRVVLDKFLKSSVHVSLKTLRLHSNF